MVFKHEKTDREDCRDRLCATVRAAVADYKSRQQPRAQNNGLLLRAIDACAEALRMFEAQSDEDWAITSPLLHDEIDLLRELSGDSDGDGPKLGDC